MDKLVETSLQKFEDTYKKHPKGSYKHELDNMKHLVCMTARQLHFNESFEDAHVSCVNAGYPFMSKLPEKEDVSNMLNAIEYVGKALKADSDQIESAKKLSCVSGMMYHTNRTQEEAIEYCDKL